MYTIISISIFVALLLSYVKLYKKNVLWAFLFTFLFYNSLVSMTDRSLAGVFWADFSLVLLMILLPIIRYASLFSALLFASIVWQLFVNLVVYLTVDEFYGGFKSVFFTPIHLYLPLLYLVVLIENVNNKNVNIISGISLAKKSFNLDVFLNKYIYVLIVSFALLFFLRLYDFGEEMQFRFSAPIVAPISAFVAVVTPFYIATHRMNIQTTLLYIFITVAVIGLSATTGSLVIFSIFIVLAYYLKSRKHILYLVTSGCVFLSIIFVASFLLSLDGFYISSKLESIVGIYLVLFLGFDPSDLNIVTGDLTRIKLWENAFIVWLDNFFIGVGTNQFPSYFSISPGFRLSPHHAVLSKAVDGGVIMVLLEFLPLIYIYCKTRLKVGAQNKALASFSALAIILSFISGYSANKYILIVFYLLSRRLKLAERQEVR